MKAKLFKKKLSKKTPLLMSPFGFALAACGGGGESGSPAVAPKLSTVLTLTPSGDEKNRYDDYFVILSFIGNLTYILRFD